MRSIVCLAWLIIGCSGSAFEAPSKPPPPADGGADSQTTTILLATGGANSATGGGSVLSPTGGASITGGASGCEIVASPLCESPDVRPAQGWTCAVNLSACPSAGFPIKCSHCK